MAKVTEKLTKEDPRYDAEGYLRTLMRWRENGDSWGAAPPATYSMVKEGAAFSLGDKAHRAKMDYKDWNKHREYMRSTYDHKYLKQFHLDYLSMTEWEVA